MAKQYGLIVPNKNKRPVGALTITRPSIFNDDSDSDGPVSKPTGVTKLRQQDKINQKKAVDEDPTVYQYDEIYDEMESKRKESKLANKDIEKKPKYISRLLAAADRRKRENEKRIEKQVQKERDAEGEAFKDKESFVTSAYKKKLEELKALEEQEKREEYLEAIGDVKKQGNLDGFYRHLYDQKVNYEDDKKPEEKDDNDSDRKRRNSSEGEKNDSKKNKSDIKRRKYRSRKDSDNNSLEEDNLPSEPKKEHLPSNLDADSDFSIDSSSESDTEEKTENNEKIEHKGEKLQLLAKGNVLSDNAALAKKNEDGTTEKETVKEENKEEKEEKHEEPKPQKPKVDIWKKRTVGEVFDEALKRYYERKAAREAATNG